MTIQLQQNFSFFDNARFPVFVFDRHGRIVFANNSASRIFGFTNQEFMRLSLADLDRNLKSKPWPEVMAGIGAGEDKYNVAIYRRRDGSRIRVLISYSISGEGEEMRCCACVHADEAERNWNLLESKLLYALEHTLDAFFLSAIDGRILHVNQSACKALGYDYAELTALRTSDIDPAEVIQEDGSVRIGGVLVNPESGTFESHHHRKNGSRFPVEVTYNNFEINGTEYSFAFARDTTQRKETERQREQLRFIVDHTSDALYIYDRAGRIRYVNDSAVKESGYTREELLSSNIMLLDRAITPEIWESGWRNAASGRDLMLESVHTRKDGSTYPVEISAIISKFDGEELGCAFVRDITERKQAFREAEELRFVVEKSIDQVMIYDHEGKFHYVNESACRTLGYSREEWQRLTLFDIAPGHTKEALNRTWDQRSRTRSVTMLESNHRAKDGRMIPVEITVNTMTIDNKEYSCAIVRDISERKAALQKLETLQFAVDNSVVPFYFYDDKGNITYANKSACQAVGYSLDELLKMKVFDIDPNVTAEVWKTMYPSVKAGLLGTISSTNRRKDGTIIPVEVTPTNMTFGDMEFGVSVNLDVSARIKAEKAIRDSEEKFRLIADTSPVALIIHKVADGAILYANRMAEALFRREIAGKPNLRITSLFDNEESRAKFLEIVNSSEQVDSRTLLLGHHARKSLWVSLNTRTITLHGEKVVCCAMLDITEAHNLSLQLSHQAAYDSLTGLVNRNEFESRLARVIKNTGSKGIENALCYLDLDQFKVINDTCGHLAGDELLRQLGHVLQTHVRKRDTLARLGGDEFAVLLENCSLLHAKRVANAIREAVHEFRFLWDNKVFSIGVSIGLVPIDRSDEDITEVMRRADAACYQAKEAGRNRIHIYHVADEELNQRQGEMRWVNRIISALEQNRLQLWAQKIISLRYPAARREQYELLLRMADVNGQIVLPGAFLPAAERYNLSVRIDRWVINNTVRWFARHPEKYKKLKMCSINLSGLSLAETDFAQDIISAFRKYKLDPGRFCFEVTETAAIANLRTATQFIRALSKFGCSFAIDDFGSGLSSFAYLKNLPVDFIKIDGVFVKDLHIDSMHSAMVKSINDVGHVLRKKTIAEFVENKRILKKLKSLGVDYAQGYGIAKPELMINPEA